jgi:class 3 adenylate cyclase/WD40 repeat protein/energy-coupling factor transporter ATP-binding protein EcfA2
VSPRATGEAQPSRDVAFLFCDLVGSTALLNRIGAAASDDVRRDVFATFRRPVEAIGGTVVKTQGDGLMAVFPTIADAVRCGLAMLRGIDGLARRDPDVPLAIRVGVSSGRATHEEEDWYGPPVIEAARLCDAAGSGELYAPSRVADLARTDWLVEPAGALELKGFPAPFPSVRVSEPGRSDAGNRWVVPPELDTSLDPSFLDRDGHRATLSDRVDRTLGDSSAMLVLVGGDAGTGRSRLVAEVAQHAADAATVLFGRSAPSDEPLAPFVQALRWLALATPTSDLRTMLGRHAPVLAAMVPAIARRLGIEPPPSVPAIDARIDAVCGCLGRASIPIVLVVEDIHVADAATLVALALLTDASGPLVVLATHRPPLATHGDALQVMLAKLEGDPAVLRVTLTPFGVAGAAHLLAASGAGHVDDDASLAAVVRETGGSAVRIVEVARRFAAGESSGVTLAETMRVVCPYKGLEHFDASDASRYHGRRELVSEIVERLDIHRFVGLVGASGSGKSSLLRAGVLPAITGATAVRTPGDRPMESLNDARRALGYGPGVLAFDQLEECFTLCGDAMERMAFLDALTEPGPHRVVVAVRGDFYAHFAVHPASARALERSTVLVGPMTQAELEEAVERPALEAGLTLQGGLVDLVVTDVVDEPGGLPLLSHAMRETWRGHRGGVLTIADYRATGGARGAIARSADLAFTNELDGSEQAIARAMFLRLTELGDGTAVTRRRVGLEEMSAVGDDPRAAAHVLTVLTAARLIIVDENAVEVAHEALIREWPRLRAWLDEDRDALRMQAHLTQSARDWEAAGRPAEDLYAGARLEAVSERAESGSITPTAAERAFLDASWAQQSAGERREQRNRRRLRRLLVATGVALVLAIIAGAVALIQRGEAQQQAGEAQRQAAAADREAAEARRQRTEAERQTTEAQRQATLADQRRLAAEGVALVSSRPDTAALLAVEAGRRGRLEETDAALAAALLRFPALVRHLSAGEQVLTQPVTSPDRRVLAAISGITIVVFETVSGSLLRRIDVGDEIRTLAFVSDTVVAAATTAEIRTWDTSSGAPVGAPIEVAEATSIALSPDGSRLAIGADDTTVRVTDLQGGVIAEPVTVGSGPVTAIAWFPDSVHLIAGNGFPRGPSVGTSTVEVWDTTSRTRTLAVDVAGLAVREVAVDTAGQRALVASAVQGVVTLIDLASGSTVELDDGRQVLEASALFLPDDTAAFLNAAGGIERYTTHGDLDQPVGSTPGTANAIGPVGLPIETPTTAAGRLAPGPDGTVFVTASSGGIVQAALDGGGALLRPLGDESVDDVGAFGVGGTQLAVTVGVPRRSVVLDTTTGARIAGPFDGATRAWPTPRRLVVGDEAGRVSVVDPTDTSTLGSPIDTGLGYTQWAEAPGDGTVTLVSSLTAAALVDLENGQVLRHLDLATTVGGWLRQAAMSPDGAHVALVTTSESVEIQDAVSGQVVARPELGAGRPTALAYSADGETLAVGTETGTVILVGDGGQGPPGAVLRGQRAAVAQIAIATNGIVVVAFIDGTMRLFGAQGAPLGTAIAIAPLTTLAVTDAAVAFIDPAYRLVVVNLDASGWPAIAETWAGRTLTDAERQQFGLDS